MLDSMSPEIKDESIRDKQGQVVAGGSLFRKYLLNRCQEEFERGWKVNLPEKPEGVTEEAAMMSDEYYAAAAAKRRGLGLVKFIGELYKLGMLTERIMHECVKKLVDYEGIPEEAEVESLTSLLRTIGYSLDNSEKGHGMMDAYFGRIAKMVDTPGLQSRLRFMLMVSVLLNPHSFSFLSFPFFFFSLHFTDGPYRTLSICGKLGGYRRIPTKAQRQLLKLERQ
jgi:translation initiation factor 4G